MNHMGFLKSYLEYEISYLRLYMKGLLCLQDAGEHTTDPSCKNCVDIPLQIVMRFSVLLNEFQLISLIKFGASR
jgi:hypothetical protein